MDSVQYYTRRRWQSLRLLPYLLVVSLGQGVVPLEGVLPELGERLRKGDNICRQSRLLHGFVVLPPHGKVSVDPCKVQGAPHPRAKGFAAREVPRCRVVACSRNRRNQEIL